LTGLDPEPESARPADAPAVVALRDAAARWMADHGIVQWVPGEVRVAVVRRQIDAGEWFVHRVDGVVRGTLRVIESDEEVWGARPPDALYVHGLAVDRSLRGAGLGSRLLDWAGTRAARAGRSHLRLDCVETNARLRAYYRGQGFREVGRSDRDGGRHPVTLLERELLEAHAKNPGGR
jgi:ribosomal protein S18 acetylase RimI-like enzyme